MTIDDLITLVRDELGLDVTSEDVSRGLDQVTGWDSVHLLAVATAIEQQTGRRLSLPDLLAASSLADIHAVAVGP
jgi:acyl carrier protein